jgi:hypothetical protein
LRGGNLADEDDGKSGADATRRKVGDLAGYFSLDLSGDGNAIEDVRKFVHELYGIATARPVAAEARMQRISSLADGSACTA